MPYLRLSDYSRAIQDVQLSQIISSNQAIRILAENEAEAEAISYLTQKYNTEYEFRPTTVFVPEQEYLAGDLVELDAELYDESETYNEDDLALVKDVIYICDGTGITGAFNPSDWTVLGNRYDLYYVTLPAPEFNYKSLYKVGDEVFWNNSVYTCLIATPTLDQQTALQYKQTSNLPTSNVFPDDPVNGLQYWGTGTPYSLTTRDVGTGWTKGDNRSVQLVYKLIDICLFNLHSRISPKNIPQLRMDRYASAIAWLDMAKAGEITADIPLRQPKNDGRIRWGGGVRNVNEY